MIFFKNTYFSYEKDVPVLDSINLEISPGLTLLLGPNGCGKSTILKLAAGVEKPDSGQVLIGGYDLWKNEAEARRSLSYLPEHPDLTPYATLKEILKLVCRLRDEPLEKGREALEFFDLHKLSGHTVRELSMGQRRRVLFAACFVGKPKYILLDEPLEGMDRAIQTEILDWINRHNQAGAVVVVASHFLEPFIDTVSQAMTIRDGKVKIFTDLSDTPGRKVDLLDELSKGIIST